MQEHTNLPKINLPFQPFRGKYKKKKNFAKKIGELVHGLKFGVI